MRPIHWTTRLCGISRICCILSIPDFRAHNDGDEGLDGLEMLKAMLHHNHKGHEALEDNSDPVIHKTEEEVIALVDSLIENYDENENGLLEYAEFMKAFEETQATLGI